MVSRVGGDLADLYPAARKASVLFAYPPLGWWRRTAASMFGWLPSAVDGERLGDLERMIDGRMQARAEAEKARKERK